MTGAELETHEPAGPRPTQPLVKSNELSDVHAMLSKVCAYLMRREGHLTGPALEQWESGCRQMNEFCEALPERTWNM